ncbi:hypothetical protein CK489_28775 [Bradyrhizobium sp. UFLA03-84]|uniref:DUF2513 domain-containing protein n=1 Tax=Bradyrhizobium sp. UFLA03-84 TaxID=418599 RepID=UPI000BAE637A|nr:DUF2513 domain-containing protein [Bradyrhizobium sp. UFLA03-84]PAY05387.1 hypothetical protein CK489_28775 [Bradyrhizobium sp. UFLA03-84]
MRRDLNLVRDILLALEPLGVNADNPVPLKIGETPLIFDGHSSEKVAYHVRIMTQGNLINTGGIAADGVTVQNFYGLSWHGHEVVDDVRDPKAWADAMAKMNKYGSFGMSVAWELAKAYMRSHALPF